MASHTPGPDLASQASGLDLVSLYWICNKNWPDPSLPGSGPDLASQAPGLDLVSLVAFGGVGFGWVGFAGLGSVGLGLGRLVGLGWVGLGLVRVGLGWVGLGRRPRAERTAGRRPAEGALGQLHLRPWEEQDADGCMLCVSAGRHLREAQERAGASGASAKTCSRRIGGSASQSSQVKVLWDGKLWSWCDEACGLSW